MKYLIRKTATFGLAALIGLTTACADLDVVNPNAPDADRVLVTPGDIETLIAGGYRNWWNGTQHENSGGPIMANQSFMFSSWPANFGMFDYSLLPSQAIVNQPTHGFYDQMVAWAWSRYYRALAAVSDGLNSIEADPDIADAIDVRRITAFGKFIQGLAHGSLALLYDEAWILDENTQRTDDAGFALPLETRPYTEVLDAALGYLDEAIALSQTPFDNGSIPSAWASRSISNAELARVASSFKVLFRVNVARHPAEREAVNWAAVIADMDNGITADYTMQIQHLQGPWWSRMAGQFTEPNVGWGQVSYFIDGMADQSGRYQEWLSLEVGDRHPNLPSGPFLIDTPDLRFPQGATEAEQRENPGMDHAVSGSPHIIVGPLSWGQPARGSHRWSYYQRMVAWFHRQAGSTPSAWPVITVREMDLLRAEAAFHGGPTTLAEAVDIINETRTAAGLLPADVLGANLSCVPRLPNGECGDLWEMYKWEKRMETAFFGLHSVPWWFDMRGWGDLYLGTPLQRPVPCQDREILQALDPGLPGCNTHGGVGDAFGSPGSSYSYPFEG